MGYPFTSFGAKASDCLVFALRYVLWSKETILLFGEVESSQVDAPTNTKNVHGRKEKGEVFRRIGKIMWLRGHPVDCVHAGIVDIRKSQRECISASYVLSLLSPR